MIFPPAAGLSPSTEADEASIFPTSAAAGFKGIGEAGFKGVGEADENKDKPRASMSDREAAIVLSCSGLGGFGAMVQKEEKDEK